MTMQIVTETRKSLTPQKKSSGVPDVSPVLVSMTLQEFVVFRSLGEIGIVRYRLADRIPAHAARQSSS